MALGDDKARTLLGDEDFDDDDDDEKDDEKEVELEVDVYNEKPLPYLIGSRAFLENDIIVPGFDLTASQAQAKASMTRLW